MTQRNGSSFGETIDGVTGEVLGPQSIATQQQGERAQLAVGAATALAMAAKEQAVVTARFQRADIRPRNWAGVRQKLLEECRRPEFADEAMYSKPIGNERIEGLSIRFAEAAGRVIGNVDIFADLIDQTRFHSYWKVGALDLETNAMFSETLTISKTIERSTTKDGLELVSTRKNSKGHTVYVYVGTDDDVVIKQRSAISKSKRNQLLALLPADIKAECEKTILETQRNRDKQDPTKARKQLMDAFYTLGIKVSELEEYLGHSVDTTKPEEFADLRKVHAALRDKETTWADVMATRSDRAPKRPQAAPSAPPQQAPSAPASTPETATQEGSQPEDDSLLGRIRRMTKEQVAAIAKELGQLPKDQRSDAGAAFAARRRELGL